MENDDVVRIDDVAPGSDGVKLMKVDGRLVVRAFNQGGYDAVDIDVAKLIQALRQKGLL